MKILLSTFCLTEINGTYFRAHYLGRELAKRSHDVTLAAISPTSRFRTLESAEAGMRIIQFPNFMHKLIFHHGNGPLDIAARVRLLMREDFDVVHGFEYYANVMAPIMLTKRLKDYVYVSDWCDWFSKGMALKGRRFSWCKPAIKLVGMLEEQARLRADGVTVISHELEAKVQSMRVSSDRVMRLPGGAPSDLIVPLDRTKAREELGFPRDASIAAFAGNYQADVDIFLKAFAAVAAKRPGCLMVLLGSRPSGELAALISQLGLDDRVVRPGFVSTSALGQYLASSDICLLPMRDNDDNRSRWPNKIGDYMAAGRPIVASRVGDVVDVMTRHEIGFLVENDPAEVADRIEWIFGHPVEAAAMGDNGRALAEREYSWASLAGKVESFYHSLS